MSFDPFGAYQPRAPYQSTYVIVPSKVYAIGCPECGAPPYLDCMSLNAPIPRRSQLPRYPVRAHDLRKKFALRNL